MNIQIFVSALSFIDNFHNYVQVKTLMWLQSIVGGDKKLIVNFIWPNVHII